MHRRPETLSVTLTIVAEDHKCLTVQDSTPPYTGLNASVEGPINPMSLTIVARTGVFRASDHTELPQLNVPEATVLAEFAHDVTNALAFITDEHMTLAYLSDRSVLIPDTPDDAARLSELGTTDVWFERGAIGSIRTVVEPSNRLVAALLPKRAGLMIYADALALARPAAQYRELWRVLESGFGCQDNDLVDTLASYAPATEMAFTREELRRLLVLRGRASHAGSKAGRTEIARVNHETARRIPRMKALVDRVLLTKKAWGRPTAGVEALMPLGSFVGPDNAFTIYKS